MWPSGWYILGISPRKERKKNALYLIKEFIKGDFEAPFASCYSSLQMSLVFPGSALMLVLAACGFLKWGLRVANLSQPSRDGHVKQRRKTKIRSSEVNNTSCVHINSIK